MKLLLDTHTILWFLGDVEKLSEAALSAILDPENEKYVSIASAWELVIKISLGKLSFEGGIANFFMTVEENDFEILPIKGEYIKQLEELPFHHRDPFDKMLIALATVERMCLISIDKKIHLLRNFKPLVN
jgi:PIN domain nuclease of toxin-antitoxin system